MDIPETNPSEETPSEIVPSEETPSETVPSQETPSEINPSETPSGMDSSEEKFPITKIICVAQREKGKLCPNKPTMTCEKCSLPAYCSEECRADHWDKVHQHGCPTELLKEGKYAAIDVLNLAKTEGKFFNGNLNLLFAGDSGLRHLIYTIAKLPTEAHPNLTLCLAEPELARLARTIFIIMLLTDETQSPMVNAEIATHLWYSCRIPKTFLDHLNSIISTRLLQHRASALDECRLNQIKDPGPQNIKSAHGLLSLELLKVQWELLLRFSTLPQEQEPNTDDPIHMKHTASLGACEAFGPALATMSPARFIGSFSWRYMTRLVPYSQPSELDLVSNQLFYLKNKIFLMGAAQEPLAEWPMKELLSYPCEPGYYDIYCKMFFYVRDMLVLFQAQIKKLKPKIELIGQNLQGLGVMFASQQAKRFNRVEAGTCFDRNYLSTLVFGGRLLRHRDENPHARLLAITRESVDHKFECVKSDLEEEEKLMFKPTGYILDNYAPFVDAAQVKDPAGLRRRLGLLAWRSWDKFSDQYLSCPTQFEVLRFMKGDFYSRGITGVRLETKNIITRRWPNRLIHSKSETPKRIDFYDWMGWGDRKPERWLEWSKRDDLPNLDAWKEWCVSASYLYSGAKDYRQDAICDIADQIREEDGESFPPTLAAPTVEKENKPVNIATSRANAMAEALIEEERQEKEGKAEEDSPANKGKGKKKAKKKKNKSNKQAS